MFKKSSTTSQMDLFSSPEMFLGRRAVKSYSDPKGWHNVFFDLVTSKIDEGIFSVLYKSGNTGAPTASVRILVAMSISPSLGTYYLFKRRLCDYADKTGVDLMEQCFEHITGQQIKRFNISGKSVRMDSKLIGSNITKYSRYEIVLRTLQKTLFHECNMHGLNPALRKKAEPLMVEKGNHTVYTSDAATLSEKIASLGAVVYAVLKRLKAWMNMRRLVIYMFKMTPEEYEKYILTLPKSILAYIKRICRSIFHSDVFLKRGSLEDQLDFRKSILRLQYCQKLKYTTF